MGKSKKPTVALIYDFDGTLSPGNMQEFGFIQATGLTTKEFWTKNSEVSKEQDASEILCYMKLMIDEAKHAKVQLTRKSFQSFGAKVELFKGVQEWFDLINEYGKERGIKIEHYINSSGLTEMIEGTSIARKFKKIYASSFLYDVHGIAEWPAVAVDFTAKTQFLFMINKGIENIKDNKRVNDYMSEEERPIHFRNMIYFGDGKTDIPCMKMVKENGGHSIAVLGNSSKDNKKKTLKLITEDRVNFVCQADYSENKDIHNVVKRILDKIKTDHDFERLLNVHKQKATSKKPDFYLFLCSFKVKSCKNLEELDNDN